MSLLHGSANSGIALRERSAAGEWLLQAKWISSSWSFPVWHRPH
jgi:hypothetical protein